MVSQWTVFSPCWLVEILAHLTGEQKRAVEFIGPLVIGADELRRVPLSAGADARAAMATGIVQSADLPLAVAYDDDRIVANLNGEVVAGFGTSQSWPMNSQSLYKICSMSSR